MKRTSSYLAIISICLVSFLLLFSCVENTAEEIKPEISLEEIDQVLTQQYAEVIANSSDKGNTKATGCFEVRFRTVDCVDRSTIRNYVFYFDSGKVCASWTASIFDLLEQYGYCVEMVQACTPVNCPSDG